ncbi:MAG: DUF4845 domain-containing protein [Pseudomonadota bacterium]
MQSRHRQQGFMKLFFIFGSIAFVAIVGLKLFPLYANQIKVAKVVKSAASEGNMDPLQVRNSLQRRWDIDDITIITPKDILIERGQNGGGALVYNYEARTHLFYNVDLVLTFEGREPVKGF